MEILLGVINNELTGYRICMSWLDSNVDKRKTKTKTFIRSRTSWGNYYVFNTNAYTQT